jgi:hypothetical protein
LNDALLSGPTIQDDLFSILLRFRKHRFVFTADIEKMFRQVRIHDSQLKYQQILWRSNTSDPIQTYQLNTVTYGTTSAPYLAIKTLHQLATDEQHQHPHASEVVKKDFYVDDVITGCNTIKEAHLLQQDLMELLIKGGFVLHKWCANDSRLLENMPIGKREMHFQIEENDIVKTLGVVWNLLQ